MVERHVKIHTNKGFFVFKGEFHSGKDSIEKKRMRFKELLGYLFDIIQYKICIEVKIKYVNPNVP